MDAPDPNVVHPMPAAERVVLLKAVVKSPLIEVGDYSYYDDPVDPTSFETRNVLYNYGPERLRIGKYCALGEGTTFIMNGANHRIYGPSTFAFPIMGARDLRPAADRAGRRECAAGAYRIRPRLLQARYGDHWIPVLLRKQRAG